MGGRRAASLTDFVGSRKALAQRIQSGFESEDPRAISRAAADVAKKVVPKPRLNSYLGLLVPFVRRQLVQETPSPDLRSEVRKEWSRLKKKHDIKVTRVISEAVVQATIDVLKARR